MSYAKLQWAFLELNSQVSDINFWQVFNLKH